MSQRVPAHDLLSEASVLSACLLSATAFDDVRAILPSPDTFFSEQHRRIYEAALAVDAGGGKVDTTTVAAWLNEHQRLAQVGGTAYLLHITDATPTVLHVEDHARIVLDRWRVRRVVAEAQAVAAEGYSDVGDTRAWLQSVESRMFSATQAGEREDTVMTMRDAVAEECADMREREHGRKVLGLRTGLPSVDRKIGGLLRKQKYTLAARPGMGKTACALSIALKVAGHGDAVAFVSLEMPRQQLVQRAIAQDANINTQTVGTAKLTAAQWRDAALAFKRLSDLPIAIDDRGEQTAASIRSSVRRCMSKLAKRGHTAPLGLVIVDYLQIMTPSDKRGRNRENDVAELSNGTRQLAKEFDCAVLELSQLSRQCELRQDKRPVLADLRESGAIEQDSFGVFFLYRDNYYLRDSKPDPSRPDVCEFLIRKIRQGGSCGMVEIGFKADTTAFYELERDDGYEFENERAM